MIFFGIGGRKNQVFGVCWGIIQFGVGVKLICFFGEKGKLTFFE